MAASRSLGESARIWVEQTHGQVARELGILQEAMLERVDLLGSELASASHEELAEVEGVQAYAEAFLVDAGQLLENLANKLDDGLAERLTELLQHAEGAGEDGVEARLAVARWRRDAQQYLTFVAQYVAGYVQGGGVALGLLLEMPEGPIDRAVITSIVRHRLMFAADRAELAATRWAEEVGAELVEVARRLDSQAPSQARRAPPQVESFDLFGPDDRDDTVRDDTQPAGQPAEESASDRLKRLLDMASDLGVKVKKVPENPSHTWLDKMETQLDAVAEKRRAQAETLAERKARLARLMAFADTLKVKVKKVPDNPSDSWLDKMEAKLAEVAEKKGVPLPSHEPEAPSSEDGADDPQGDGGDPEEEPDDRHDDDMVTSDVPPEREVAPSKISPEERQERIEAMVKKAKKAELDLGNVPDEPSDEWLETTEQRLETALEKRRAERKAAREKKKRERDARIERLKADVEALGIEMGPVPKFPTEDWLSRMEMKVASARLPHEEDLTGDDRAERLAAILAEAKEKDVELGEVPPDPDNLWLRWAEGRLSDADASDELIAAPEDPEEEPAARPRIVFEEGTVQERMWVMEEGELTIGRARGNHVQIRDDRGVSRLHCTLFEQDGTYFVRDNGSTKGTLVNGHLVVDDQPIEAGARIRIGDTEMVFRA